MQRARPQPEEAASRPLEQSTPGLMTIGRLLGLTVSGFAAPPFLRGFLVPPTLAGGDDGGAGRASPLLTASD